MQALKFPLIMKYLSLACYGLLVLTSGISNFFVSHETQKFELAMVISLHFGAIIFYFLFRLANENARVMLNAKYFCCFPMRYKEFIMSSLIELLLLRLEILPLLLLPLTLFSSDILPINATIVFLALQLTTIYTLFILLIIYHWLSVLRLKINFAYILLLSFALPFWFAYKQGVYLGLALNPLGTFISAPLLFIDHPRIIFIILLQLIFITTLLLLVIKRGLRQWPTF